MIDTLAIVCLSFVAAFNPRERLEATDCSACDSGRLEVLRRSLSQLGRAIFQLLTELNWVNYHTGFLQYLLCIPGQLAKSELGLGHAPSWTGVQRLKIL